MRAICGEQASKTGAARAWWAYLKLRADCILHAGFPTACIAISSPCPALFGEQRWLVAGSAARDSCQNPRQCPSGERIGCNFQCCLALRALQASVGTAVEQLLDSAYVSASRGKM
jgi:hypothetical protein